MRPILGQTHLAGVEALSETSAQQQKGKRVQRLKLGNPDLLVAFLKCAKAAHRCSLTHNGFMS